MMISAPLLVVVALMIALASIASWVLLRTSREDKEVAARIAAVSDEVRPKRAIALPSITKREEKSKTNPREVLAGLFGFSLARTDQYPLQWYWVVIIAVVAGRLAALLGNGMFGSLSWALFPIVTLFVSRGVFNSMIQKRMNKLRNQLPVAIGLIVRAVRVGVPVTEALRAVSREDMQPTSGEFGRLADSLLIGTSLESGLRTMAERNGLPEYGFFAAALTLQAQTGGGLAETLELLADVTRKRVSMRDRGHALSSEARTSSLILAALPIVSGGSIYLINPEYISLLFTNPTGQMILGTAILSLGIGVFAMRMIISKALAI